MTRSETTEKKYDVFVSYNSKEKHQVIPIAAFLRDSGLNVFVDAWSFKGGNPWIEVIETVLSEVHCCLVFWGPSGFGPTQNQERQLAQVEAGRRKDFVIIPVLLPNAPSVRGFLETYTWIDSTDRDKLLEHIRQGKYDSSSKSTPNKKQQPVYTSFNKFHFIYPLLLIVLVVLVSVRFKSSFNTTYKLKQVHSVGWTTSPQADSGSFFTSQKSSNVLIQILESKMVFVWKYPGQLKEDQKLIPVSYEDIQQQILSLLNKEQPCSQRLAKVEAVYDFQDKSLISNACAVLQKDCLPGWQLSVSVTHTTQELISILEKVCSNL